MANRVRPYLFYDVAVSICSTCYRKVEGKIVFENGSVFMLKRCPAHGSERVLMADDIEYYRRCREVFIKPPEMPLAFNTPVRWGCPYDCGLCADHQQHSCLSLVEITDRCNLECPICYAGSGPSRHQYRTLDHVQRLIDAVVRNEGEPDVVQISGGEPTVHPDFFAILDRAKKAPIRHLMVNTNGLRIAHDEEFAKRLAGYMPDFEIYLQFDSLEAGPLLALRGVDLRDVHAQALERLNRLGISTTLVVTLKKGLNDGEIGRIIDFAVTQPSVRGVTFQPIQAAGRLERFDPATDRLTLTEVRRRILEQTTLFRPEDLLPVPCHPDSLAMAYALKIDGKLIPLTGLIDPKVLIEGGRNTIVYEGDDAVREARVQVVCHEPLVRVERTEPARPPVLPPAAGCTRQISAIAIFFDVLIMQFIDAYSFDVRSVKKTCVHIVHPDGRLIPFDTYNLFYRDGLEQSRLAPLRQWAERSMLEEMS